MADHLLSAARNARTAFGVLAQIRRTRVRVLLAFILVAAMVEGQTNASTHMSNRAPAEVNEWAKLFTSHALYRHETSRLFEDYLDLCICCFANRTLEERYLSIAKRYTREELDTMAKLMGMMIVIHEEHTAGGGWYDSLGQIYEYLASRSKASRLGQFFTPEHVCDVIARITLGDDVPAGATMLDPACGSGRMLLAGHALHKDHGLFCANDVDPVCVKMCALNFWMHGIRGEVACMNSLSLQWYFAFQTHPRHLWPFITYLDESRKEESVLYTRREEVATAAKTSAPPDLFSTVEEPAPLYGEAARRQRYFENEKRQVLGTLKEIADVLERNKADEEFAKNKKRIALELRLRGIELKGDAVSCYLGKTWCRFPWWNIKDVISNAKSIYKQAA